MSTCLYSRVRGGTRQETVCVVKAGLALAFREATCSRYWRTLALQGARCSIDSHGAGVQLGAEPDPCSIGTALSLCCILCSGHWEAREAEKSRGGAKERKRQRHRRGQRWMRNDSKRQMHAKKYRRARGEEGTSFPHRSRLRPAPFQPCSVSLTGLAPESRRVPLQHRASRDTRGGSETLISLVMASGPLAQKVTQQW